MSRGSVLTTTTALVATLVTGCQPFGPQPTPPASGEPTAATAQPTQRPEPSQTPASRLTGTVRWVLDGDTFDLLAGDRRTKRVRLLGVDAPESASADGPAQCGASTAKKALQKLLPVGASVVVTLDPRADDHDRFGRTLGYVSRSGLNDAGLRLLKDGMVEAWAPRSAPTPSRMSSYRNAERKAKQANRGLWKACPSIGR